MKIRLVGTELFNTVRQVDRQTDGGADGQTEVTDHKFANAPKNYSFARRAHCCGLYGSQNEQRLSLYRFISVAFATGRCRVYCTIRNII